MTKILAAIAIFLSLSLSAARADGVLETQMAAMEVAFDVLNNEKTTELNRLFGGNADHFRKEWEEKVDICMSSRPHEMVQEVYLLQFSCNDEKGNPVFRFNIKMFVEYIEDEEPVWEFKYYDRFYNSDSELAFYQTVEDPATGEMLMHITITMDEGI